MKMEKTWRWYGPKDSITLADIKQIGVTGIVNALHEVPIGDVWTYEAVMERKKTIENSGLKWSVIESIPVHEDIKQGKPSRDTWIENYKQSIINVGKAGIPVVTYNWMPVVDWTRTNLELPMDNGAIALGFDLAEFVAFDVYILKRENAIKDYSQQVLKAAEKAFEKMPVSQYKTLQNNIIAGLPGGQQGYSLDEFKLRLAEYKTINAEKYRENLAYFLHQIIPVAIQAGVKMAIHPDDPPISLFGLPRIVSTQNDLQYIVNIIDSVANGLCFCTGSLAARSDNNIPMMAEKFGSKINFLHLRNVKRDSFNGFYESGHLDGDIDMYNVVYQVLKEQHIRNKTKRLDVAIPMRADHGHALLDDQKKKTNPGYTAIGRLKGMAELTGLETGILQSQFLDN